MVACFVSDETALYIDCTDARKLLGEDTSDCIDARRLMGEGTLDCIDARRLEAEESLDCIDTRRLVGEETLDCIDARTLVGEETLVFGDRHRSASTSLDEPFLRSPWHANAFLDESILDGLVPPPANVKCRPFSDCMDALILIGKVTLLFSNREGSAAISFDKP